MVQVFTPSPRAMQMGQIGESIGQGMAKRLGLMEAEQGLQQAQGNPFKLATAMARLISTSPELERAAAPMYNAMMNLNKAQAAAQQYGKIGSENQFSPGTQQEIERYTKQDQGKQQVTPDLTTRESAQETIRPYLPRTRDQNMQRAVELLQKNPQLFENDLNKAYESAVQEDATNLQRSQAIQASGQSQKTAQESIKTQLRDLNQKFGGGKIVPENMYNRIQNEALESMLPKSEGGEGLTEQEASQKYIGKLDKIARDYKAVDDLGDWTMAWQSRNSVLTNMENLRQQFEKNNDLENYADYMISHNDLSPRFAYSRAYPINKDIPVYQELKNLKSIDPSLIDAPKTETKKIMKKIAEKLNPNSSPLSIAHYLSRKNYDPQPFLEYLVQNQDQLKLTAAQVRQLSKGQQLFPKLNDLWLMSQIGEE